VTKFQRKKEEKLRKKISMAEENSGLQKCWSPCISGDPTEPAQRTLLSTKRGWDFSKVAWEDDVCHMHPQDSKATDFQPQTGKLEACGKHLEKAES
jgi:hypothetical protein